jgi:D-alanine--poly(phosphoribitol) ligase subunit 1
MDIIQRIDDWAKVHPQRVAHKSSGQTLTYGELALQSNKLADHLSRALPDDGSPVVLLGHKEIEMTIAFIGCIKSGHPYVPLESSLPEQRVTAVVETAQSPLVLTVEKIREILETNVENPELKIRTRKPDDVWYIIFTSGSTGNPKGVMITRASLENFISWTIDEHKMKEAGEIILNQAPFTFDVSILDIYCSLYTAGTFVSVTKDEIANLKELFKTLPASNATMWVSTPSFARLCLMEPAFGEKMIPTIRKFWLAGETLAPEIATDLMKRFPRAELWNAYGPTEATVVTTSVQITPEMIAKYNPLPIGYPMPGSRILIHNKEGQSVPEGDRGEIIIAGPNVSIGYINRPDLTARVFFELDAQRAYHTGDWGRYQDGLVFYDGRMDFQIKLHGYRIELGDIEANLHALSTVQDAIVVPVMKEGRTDHLVAFVILKEKSPESEFEAMQKLKQQLGERVPEYMVPRRFIFAREFPITNNGKADRRKLAEMIP